MGTPEINGTGGGHSTIQLIDADCNFKSSKLSGPLAYEGSEQIGTFIQNSKLEGFGYHLVAVFGSQSTGKSTLHRRGMGFLTTQARY
jgi:hypothetical protein